MRSEVASVAQQAEAVGRANRKVPDVCNSFGQVWIKDFDLYRTLGFKA